MKNHPFSLMPNGWFFYICSLFRKNKRRMLYRIISFDRSTILTMRYS
jgi:hypothetical protein